MYNPLNIVNIFDHIVKTDQNYINYQKIFKEKYNINSSILNLISLIELEDLIALKLEKNLTAFNGKMLFPLKAIYLNLLDIAYNKVIDSYEDVKTKKLIRSTFNGLKHKTLQKIKNNNA